MADVGSIYAETGRDIASHISSAFQRLHAEHQKEEDARQRVQGVLDAAKTIQVNDPKTGKPKPFFSPDQVRTVQHLLDLHKAAQAGAMAGAFGMGQHAANRAAMLNNAQAGPLTYTTKDGTFLWNPSSGGFSQINPRDPKTGLTASASTNEAQKAQAFKARAADQQQKQFDKTLGTYGVNRAQLFNPNGMELGVQQGGQFFVPGQTNPLTKTTPFPNDPKTGAFDKSQANAVRVGYRAPVYPLDAKTGEPDTEQKPIDPGKPGTILTPDELTALQHQAISMGDPRYASAQQTIDYATGLLQKGQGQLPNGADAQQTIQNAQLYMQKARSALSPGRTANPEYIKQILGAAANKATDVTSQVSGDHEVAPQQVDQPAPPPPPDEPNPADGGE